MMDEDAESRELLRDWTPAAPADEGEESSGTRPGLYGPPANYFAGFDPSEPRLLSADNEYFAELEYNPETEEEYELLDPVLWTAHFHLTHAGRQFLRPVGAGELVLSACPLRGLRHQSLRCLRGRTENARFRTTLPETACLVKTRLAA